MSSDPEGEDLPPAKRQRTSTPKRSGAPSPSPPAPDPSEQGQVQAGSEDIQNESSGILSGIDFSQIGSTFSGSQPGIDSSGIGTSLPWYSTTIGSTSSKTGPSSTKSFSSSSSPSPSMSHKISSLLEKSGEWQTHPSPAGSGASQSGTSSPEEYDVDDAYVELPAHIIEFHESHTMEFDNMDIDKADEIGDGTYGKVVKAVVAHTLDSDEPEEVAIKVIKTEKNQRVDAIDTEFKIADKLKAKPHHNIVAIVTAFGGSRFTFQNKVRHYVIMELSPIGDLKSAVEETNANGVNVWMPLHEKYCQHLIRGVAEGLKHLFDIGIAHGDLKLENILLFWTMNVPPEVDTNAGADRFLHMIPKLIDFNNSQIGVVDSPIIVRGARCSINTAAPESWYTGGRPYDLKVADVFSVGAVLLSLLTGGHPFLPPSQLKFGGIGVTGYAAVYGISREGHKYFNLDRNEYSILVRQQVSLLARLVAPFGHQVRQLLLGTLKPIPANRMSIDDLLGHPWFGSVT